MPKYFCMLCFCLVGTLAVANEPESSGIPASCEVSGVIMSQRLNKLQGSVSAEKTVAIAEFNFTSQVPNVDFSVTSVKLSGEGQYLDGQHYLSESQDLVIEATLKSEVVDGPVEFSRVHVYRPVEGRMRKFDCKLTTKDAQRI